MAAKEGKQAKTQTVLQNCNSVPQFHPLADVVPGGMSEEEFEALCKSIKIKQQVPIVMFEGKVLDGRVRYKACVKMGVKPKTVEFDGTVDEAQQFVLDNNLHRRRLSAMQKAMVAARMCTRKENPISQRDAASAVGCSPTSVNLCVRLINSNNASLIKRTEKGDATHGEVDELLYDRQAANSTAPVRTGTAAAASGDASRSTGDDDFTPDDDPDLDELLGTKPPAASKPGSSKSSGGKGAQIIPLRGAGSGVTGSKPSHTERKPKETSASRVVAAFKLLDAKERKDFVDMAWQWLEPAIKAAGRYAATGGNVTKAKAKVKAKARKAA